MIDKLCIIGHPSKLGGADTELDHQIHIWQKLGIKVYILHTGIIDDNLKSMNMEDRGCIILAPEDWSQCKDMHVISYCNDQFLKNLQEIKKYAKSTTFVNCMTWLFDDERACLKNNLIDYEIFQRDEVKDKNKDEILSYDNNVKLHTINPYFHNEDFPFIPPEYRSHAKFKFGRIHRADCGKFHPATNWIYETMVAPQMKYGIILGANKDCIDKIGEPPDYITTYDCGEISQQDFYREINVIIQPCDPNHIENLPRIAFEAMSSGVPLIVDNKGGWKDLVKHGETGFLCNDQKEFVYYSSKIAYEHDLYFDMCYNTNKYLKENWGEEKALLDWKGFFDEL